MKAGVFRKACTGIFIAALVLIATNRKQPQRPSAGVQPQQDPGVPSGWTELERETGREMERPSLGGAGL